MLAALSGRSIACPDFIGLSIDWTPRRNGRDLDNALKVVIDAWSSVVGVDDRRVAFIVARRAPASSKRCGVRIAAYPACGGDDGDIVAEAMRRMRRRHAPLLTIDAVGAPMSSNHAWRRSASGFWHLTPAMRKYRQRIAQATTMHVGVDALQQTPSYAFIAQFRTTRRNADLDNMLKQVIDGAFAVLPGVDDRRISWIIAERILVDDARRRGVFASLYDAQAVNMLEEAQE